MFEPEYNTFIRLILTLSSPFHTLYRSLISPFLIPLLHTCLHITITCASLVWSMGRFLLTPLRWADAHLNDVLQWIREEARGLWAYQSKTRGHGHVSCMCRTCVSSLCMCALCVLIWICAFACVCHSSVATTDGDVATAMATTVGTMVCDGTGNDTRGEKGAGDITC